MIYSEYQHFIFCLITDHNVFGGILQFFFRSTFSTEDIKRILFVIVMSLNFHLLFSICNNCTYIRTQSLI